MSFYNISIKNTCRDDVFGIGLFPVQGEPPSELELMPGEENIFYGKPLSFITGQVWNLVETDKLLLRVCGKRIRSRNDPILFTACGVLAFDPNPAIENIAHDGYEVAAVTSLNTATL